jgi:hypothetical protein
MEAHSGARRKGVVAQRGFAPNKRKSKGKRQKSKGKNLCAGPRAGLGRNLQRLAAVKTIVNDSILERRRKLATSRNLRGVQRNGTLAVRAFLLVWAGELRELKS